MPVSMAIEGPVAGYKESLACTGTRTRTTYLVSTLQLGPAHRGTNIMVLKIQHVQKVSYKINSL